MRKRKLLVNIRNPVGLYLSYYRFGWWRKHPLSLFQKPPTGPIDTFDAFLKHGDEHGHWINHQRNRRRVGNLSCEFICYLTDIAEQDPLFNIAQELGIHTLAGNSVTALMAATSGDGCDAARVSAVRSGEPPSAPLELRLNTMQATLAAIVSPRRDRWIDTNQAVHPEQSGAN